MKLRREILLPVALLLLTCVFVAPSLLRGAWTEAALRLAILPVAILISRVIDRRS